MREYDYSRDGVYFITICTQNREPILSEIVAGDMILQEEGFFAGEENLTGGKTPTGGETPPLRRRDDERKNVGDGFPVPKYEVVPHLKPGGYIVQKYLDCLHEKYPAAYVDDYVIMPDHVHILLGIRNPDGTGNPNGRGNPNGTGNPSPTMLGNVIGWFKYQTTKEINAILGTTGTRIWQRSYYDHVIRGDEDYWNIRKYIEENPSRWVEKMK